MATHKTGGEVDAYCTKCQLTLAHTILAMVGEKIARVRCNTCGGDHAMRSAPGSSRPSSGGTRSTTARAPRADAPQKVVISFEQRLSEKDAGAARTYSPKDRYGMDEVLQHPTFGLGIVTAVRVDKIDVDFKAAQKTLVHGRGEASAPPPKFSPPAPRASGPADKPVSADSNAGSPASPASEE